MICDRSQTPPATSGRHSTHSQAHPERSGRIFFQLQAWDVLELNSAVALNTPVAKALDAVGIKAHANSKIAWENLTPPDRAEAERLLAVNVGPQKSVRMQTNTFARRKA